MTCFFSLLTAKHIDVCGNMTYRTTSFFVLELCLFYRLRFLGLIYARRRPVTTLNGTQTTSDTGLVVSEVVALCG